MLMMFAIATSLSAKGLDEALTIPEFNSGKKVWIVRAGIGFNGTTGSAIKTQEAVWDNNNREGSFKTVPGYDVTFGFNKSFGNHPLYWGMELGLGMRGYKSTATFERSANSSFGGSDYHKKTQDDILSTYNVQFSPFTIGYKYTFLERMAADIHLGAYASYDFAGNYKVKTTDHIISTVGGHYRNDYNENESKVKISDMDTMRKYDVGFNLGVGYWYGHFNIDFTWQRGFVPIYEGGDNNVSVGSKKSDKMKQGNFFTNNFQLKLGYAF